MLGQEQALPIHISAFGWILHHAYDECYANWHRQEVTEEMEQF
jgi:hypothetical protein